VTCCKKKDCYRVWRDQAQTDLEFSVFVRDYRRYYHGLSEDNKRLWWAEHTDYQGYDKHQAGMHLKRHGRNFKYRFEPYATMKTNLATVLQSSLKMPPVRPESMQGVCNAFCCFMVAGHHDVLYQNAIRRHAYSKEAGAQPEDFDPRLGAVRAVRKDAGGGTDSKTHHARVWLQEQGKLALLDPSEDIAILPFRTCQATHEHYILDHEHKAGKPWAVYNPNPPEPKENTGLESEDGDDGSDSDDDGYWSSVSGNDQQADDDNDLEADDDNDSEENLRRRLLRAAREKRALFEEERERKRKLKYRYGNPACGVRDPSRPEDPQLASYSTFNRAWRKDESLSKLVCRAHLKFAKCDFCVRHRQLKDRKRTEEQRAKDNEDIRLHLQHVKNEKSYYYSNRVRARQHPDKILSIIIDGADQSKHHLPHFHEDSHATSEAKKFKTHLFGALAHGHGAWAFTVPDHEEQGHNVTIQVLFEVLRDIQEEYGVLPPILKLQLDNTTKQNKGQYLFGFLAMLVANGLFEEIEVNFLPVGHTHEDIDQFFSRIAVRLRCHLALSR
jgi:hypothetical protein